MNLVHYATTANTDCDLLKGDLVLMTKTGTWALSDALRINGVTITNGRGVTNSGNDYTTYTCRNFYFVPEDLPGATIETDASSYTSYYLMVFRPEPAYRFREKIETDLIDAEIHPDTNYYAFESVTEPSLCVVALTKGYAPNSTSTVTGGTTIDARASFTMNTPDTAMVAMLKDGGTYQRWGSVGLSFPLVKAYQGQVQIVGL